ncbi:MAG: hypothetical protein SP4CHLAM5_04950 [Chlamydiia bacterium]|nr:hypothetical protein [Chlamydiia bacterium]MCH9618366.1 hypothetical protein [Chlamydiia bacterium]MCH9624704.1 hypothetical protein [Chlamydiia bacterium]
MLRKSLLLFTLFCSFGYSLPIFLEDAEHFYSKKSALFLGKVLVPCAILAHTSLDRKTSDLYQQNMRSESLDASCKVFKTFGSNMPITIALVSGVTVSYFSRGTKTGEKIYDYSLNTFRGIVSGFPILIAGQNLLGGDRPAQNTNSYWWPFSNDHGVSGHAFMGAVPFITAANMTSNHYLKAAFYLASTATGFSRLNDDKHYLSQIILGWSLAYASCDAISDTNLSIKANGNTVTAGYTF